MYHRPFGVETARSNGFYRSLVFRAGHGSFPTGLCEVYVERKVAILLLYITISCNMNVLLN